MEKLIPTHVTVLHKLDGSWDKAYYADRIANALECVTAWKGEEGYGNYIVVAGIHLERAFFGNDKVPDLGICEVFYLNLLVASETERFPIIWDIGEGWLNNKKQFVAR